MTLLPGPHHPRRPGWDCGWCGLPYPCPRGQVLLRQAYGPAEISVRMVQLMEQAVADGVPQPELFARFIAWTQPALADPIRST